ncbi:hypothetical protein ACNOYE_31735 [Nannocystaceae bacterium ST9]
MPKPPWPALGTGALAACNLPSATLEIPSEAEVETPPTQPEPARERKLGPDRRRPEIIDAQLVSGDLLRLRFSEPIATFEGVDPNDFRLSLGMAKTYMRYAYAYYGDLGEGEGHGLLRLSDPSGDADTLELHLEPDFDIGYCQELAAELADMASEPGLRAEGGVFLHYLPGATPIRDLAGNELAAIGADWVLRGKQGGAEAYEMYFEGKQARQAYRGLIPVRCGP